MISAVSNNTEKDGRVKNDTSEFIQYVTFLEFRSLGSFQGVCTLYLIGGSLATHQKWIVSTQRKWLAYFHTKSLTIRVGWAFFRELQVWDWGHLSVRLELLGVLEVGFFFGFRIYGLALQFGSLDSNWSLSSSQQVFWRVPFSGHQLDARRCPNRAGSTHKRAQYRQA